jgi:hypothetical protein
MIDPLAIVERVTQFYIESRDFNGIPAAKLLADLGCSHEELKEVVSQLIAEGKIAVVFPRPNPHIRAFADPPAEKQRAELETAPEPDYCLYPSPETLRSCVDLTKYSDRPFTLMLALGEPQLKAIPFDLSVLEVYRNDPRYKFESNDISGWLSVRDEYYQSSEMPERDKVHLQDLGFAYNDDFERAVAVYLRYLADLSREHQQIWNARRLGEGYKLHPDHYRATILGEWPEKLPIFEAFTSELSVINKMTVAMGRPPLFRNEFSEGPAGFAFLIRPTSKELDDFAHLLDKMMSENINRAFFEGEVSLEEETVRDDGKVVVSQKGTIRLLEEWFAKRFRIPDPKPLQDAIAVFRRVRQMRQKPAHAVNDTKFDSTFFKQQRQLIIDAYSAVRTLRLCLANHPNCRAIEVSDELRKGAIWTF